MEYFSAYSLCQFPFNEFCQPLEQNQNTG